VSYDTTAAGEFLDNIGSEITAIDFPFSIVAWIKQTQAQWDQTTAGDIVCFGDDTVDIDDSVRLQRANLALALRAVTIDNAAASEQATYTKADNTYEGEWVVVVGTFTLGVAAGTNSDRTVYLEDSTNSATDPTDSTCDATVFDSVKIGARLHNDGAKFNGLVSHVAIFNKVLSGPEIDALQTSTGASAGGPTPKSVASGNCICYWPLTTDQGTHTNEGSDAAGDLTVRGGMAYVNDNPVITAGGSNETIIVPTGPWR
jgi:hypothetical protein